MFKLKRQTGWDHRFCKNGVIPQQLHGMVICSTGSESQGCRKNVVALEDLGYSLQVCKGEGAPDKVYGPISTGSAQLIRM